MLSGPYRKWLLERGSLTHKLQGASQSFAVLPLKPYTPKPLREEARLLKLGLKQKTWVRQVFLCCNQQPAVFAHSVLPYKSLRGKWRELTRLGSKSLGTALFSKPGVTRTALQFRKLSAQHPLHSQAQQQLRSAPRELWARRSVFFLGNSAILVTEVFLPQALTL